MFCGNCGTQLSDDSKFCGKCGTPVEAPVVTPVAEPAPAETPVETAVEAPVATPVVDPEQEQLKNEASKSALIWGILSLAFAIEGFIVSFLGIIFACTAFKKADWFTYLNNGVLEGKAKVGRGLAKAGLIVGIIMTVFWAFYLLLIIVGVAAGIGEFSSEFGSASWYL